MVSRLASDLGRLSAGAVAGMKFYRRNVGDYAASTRHLSLLEHGAYTMFLDLYYATEAPLPVGVAASLRAIGARSDAEREAAEAVLREFFMETDAGWVHAKCEKVIETYLKKAGVARKNGANGGRKSAANRNQQETDIGSPSVTDGGQTETDNGSESVPIAQAIHKPKTKTNKSAADATPFDPLAVPGLDQAAWAEWVEYRGKGKNPLRPESYPAAARQLAALGDAQAATVTHSIASGSRGLYAPPVPKATEYRRKPGEAVC